MKLIRENKEVNTVDHLECLLIVADWKVVVLMRLVKILVFNQEDCLNKDY